MPFPEPTFTFQVTAGDDTQTDFDVLTFEGEEQISRPFEYRLTLKREYVADAQISFGAVLNQRAELRMIQGQASTPPPVRVTGIVSEFRMIRKFTDGTKDYIEYEAVLVPKVWRLKMFHQSRVFQGSTVDGIVTKVFCQPGGAGTGTILSPTTDFEFKLAEAQPAREFCAQYRESDLDFVQRLMEHEGLYYFFQQEPDDPQHMKPLKLVVTDSKSQTTGDTVVAHQPAVPTPKNIQFAEGNANARKSDAIIYRFQRHERLVPDQVVVRDYDYEAFDQAEEVPHSTSMANLMPGGSEMMSGESGMMSGESGMANTDYARVGTHQEHGVFTVEDKYPQADASTPKGFPETVASNNSDVSRAQTRRTARISHIAKIRAQELEARRVTVIGESNVVRLRPGHVFSLTGHDLFPPKEDEPPEFLVTSVQHRYVPVEVVTNAGQDDEAKETITVYRNSFTCLPAEIQYRPPRTTPVPRVPGVMTAKVVPGPDSAMPSRPTPPMAPGTNASQAEQTAYEEALATYNTAKAEYDAALEALMYRGPVDKEGRYRVEIPFDPTPVNESGTEGTSKPVRLGQPHAGADYGFHFPNRPETEMVFACIDGDPDRPLGLSMVANPWTHSPVPTTARELRTQNPWTGSIAGDELTFDEYKNVIRSARGHQIVMDDNNGSQNVGITLQTGSYINTASVSNVDVYWKTRIEMGGYRIKSGLEQGIDGFTEALGWLKNLLLRDLPEMAGMLLGMAASHVESGNYGEDTFGSTTPVGIDMKTDQAVNIKGIKGVNITSPNFFGMFSTNIVGDSKTQKEGQHVAESIAKGIIKTLWQEVATDTVNDFIDVKERVKGYKKDYPDHNKHALEAFKVRENFFKARVKAWVNILLNRTGVNISSAGELKMASVSGTTVVAGDNGMLLKSFGSLSQKANRGIDISTQQGISITTNGKPFEGKGLVSALKKFTSKLGTPGQVVSHFLIDPWAGIDSVSKKTIEDYPIDIHNKHSSVLIHTGAEGNAGAGNVMAHAHGTGDVKLFSNRGNVHLWSKGMGENNEVLLEVGSRNNLEDDESIAPLGNTGSNKALGRLALNTASLKGFASKEVSLTVGDDYKSADSDGIVITDGDTIVIKCGDSSITLNSNGLIEIQGKGIDINGSDGVDVDSSAGINVKAGGKLTLKGKGATLDGNPAKTEVKGTAIDLTAQAAKVKANSVMLG